MPTPADTSIIAPGDLPPPPLLEDHAVKRERWPVWLREEFKRREPACVWIGGSRSLVAVTRYDEDGTVAHFGHNRLARAVKVGTSESWRDTVSSRLDQVPYWRQSLLVRVWTRSLGHANALAAATVDHLIETHAAETPEVLNRDFLAIDPDLAVDRLGLELLDIAARLLIEAWDDDGLVAHLTATFRQRQDAELARKAATRLPQAHRRMQ